MTVFKKIINYFQSPSLRNDTLFYGFSLTLERLFSFLIIPVITKNLPPEFYGIWTQILITVAVISPIILLGFCSAIVRFTAGETDKQKIISIFHWMMLIILAVSLAVITIMFLFNLPISKLIFGEERFYHFIYLLALSLLVDSLFEYLISFLRAQKKIFILSIYYLLKNALRPLMLFTLIYFFHFDFFNTLIFIITFQALLVIYIYYREIVTKFGLNIDFKVIPKKRIFYFSLPLIPYTLSIWVNNFLNRYFVLHLLGIKQLSIYALNWSLASVMVLFYSSLSFTFYPYITKLWDADINRVKNTFTKITGYYFFFVLPIISILTIFGKQIINFISTSDYFLNWQIIFLLSLANAIFGLYQLNVFPLLLKEKSFLIFFLSFMVSIINIFLNIVMIPYFGLLGVSIAILISNVILLYFTTIFSIKFIPYKFPWKVFIMDIFSVLIMSLVFLIFKSIFDINQIWKLISTLMIGIFIYCLIDLLNRDSFLYYLIKT